jgi:uncharacterized membrane protein
MYMSFRELKQRAKETIQANKSSLYQSAGIYFVFQIILGLLVIPLDNVNENISSFIDIVGPVFIFPIFLANIAMIASICLDKGNEIDTFHYYKKGNFIRAIQGYLVPVIFSFLWMLPFIMLIVLSFFIWPESSIAGNLFVGLLVIGLFILGIYKSLQYSLTPYIMAADDDITAMEALEESKQLLKGKVGKYFLLNLSFIGWALLLPLTLGLISIWLIPYYNATIFEYYLSIKPKEELSQEEISEEETTE